MTREVAAYVVAAGTGVIGLLLHLQHPDMTDTRLFLTYWPLWLMLLGLNLLTVWSLHRRTRRRGRR